jgi:hypothetical protein
LLINPIELINEDRRTVISSVIQYSGKEEKLWYSVERKYGQYLTTEKMDGFLVVVLPLAMELGEDIVVKGAISEKLYHNLINYHMNIVRLAIPQLKIVKIVPDALDDGKNVDCQGAVAAGFSGGIDSYFTVLHYLLEDGVLPSYKITHLVFGNVGTHGYGGSGRKAFKSRCELLKGFPEEEGIGFIDVDSNVHDTLKSSIKTPRVGSLYMALRYLSCPLLLQSLFSKYYYAAGYSYKDSYTGEVEDDYSHTDPASLHLLSTETLEFILSGAQYSRVEKTRQLVLSGSANRYLNVCDDQPVDGKNCSVCYKCCRTLFTLELLGVIDQFSGLFDLDKWMKVRNRYIVSQVLARGHDYFAIEIREYAASIGYRFPTWQRALAQLVRFKPVHDLAKECYRILQHKSRQASNGGQ